MNLSQKCLLFFGLVVAVQVALFAGSAWFLVKAERAAKDARVSRDVSAYVAECGGTLQECVASLFMWGVSHNKSAKQRFAYCSSERASKLSEGRKIDGLDSTTSEQLKDLNLRADLIVEQLRGLQAEYTGDVTLQRISMLTHSFRTELDPMLADMSALAGKIIETHGKRAQALDSRSAAVRGLLISSLQIAFVFNLAMVGLLILGFTRGITWRLATVTDNVAKFWKSEPLNLPIEGKDEIATLDRSFHQMSAALSEARQKEQAILRYLPVGVLVCGEDGQIEWINQQAAEILPVSQESLQDKHLLELITSPRMSSIKDITSPESPRVWQITGPQGEFSAELSLSEFRHSGQLKYLVGIVDVTAREQIERIKQEFISVVSHDLRSPLTSIQINAQMIMVQQGEDQVDQEKSTAVQRIQDECQRLLRLTNDLLDVAKIESGNIQLHRDHYDLSNVIERSLNAVEPFAARKGVSLRCGAADIQAYVDEDRLIQILINLVGNAVKFTKPDTEVLLSVSESENVIRISVKDDGPGIEKQHQELIFEKFKQARASDATRGTGLGLAICKMLVEAHGGKIGVESELGQGSTFWIELPKGTG